MPKKSTKSLSNRQRLVDKYRIEKRVKGHNKKMKKLAKKNPLWKSKVKKDPGIPNLYPYKEKLLALGKRDHEIEEAGKARMRKEAQSLSQLVNKAGGAQAEYEKKQGEQTSSKSNIIPQHERDSSRKAFFKEFKKVVEESDVILEVLDARDPIGCRAHAVEQAIIEKGDKKIVLVLNKIDLVPREVVSAWLAFLRNEYPTIAFRCNTQGQKNNLSRSKGDFDTYDSLTQSTCLGGDNLLELLKNYCRSQKMKKSITVGIIGYPNTGKSSLINSLKRSKAAAVGAKPGHTRQMQEVKLDTNVVLLDCPGIVFSSGEGSDFSSADIVLRNAVEMEKITDPVSVIDSVLKRCPRERLMELYEIPVYKSSEEFLAYVAQKIGKLKKKGIPDYNAAAVSVLRDWQSGKIKFYTMPPEKKNIIASEIVTQWAKEFDLDSIVKKEASTVMDLLPMEMDQSMQVVGASGRADDGAFAARALEVDNLDEMDEEDDEYDEDVDEMEISDDDDEDDPYATGNQNNNNAKGAMMMMVSSSSKSKDKGEKKAAKRREVSGEDEYDHYEDVPVTKGKKNKAKKRKQKLKLTETAPMDEEVDNAPFDFDEFVPTAVSNMEPEEENFEFNY